MRLCCGSAILLSSFPLTQKDEFELTHLLTSISQSCRKSPNCFSLWDWFLELRFWFPSICFCNFFKIFEPIVQIMALIEHIHNNSSVLHCVQSHNKEVPRWEIFMEQELSFWLDLGRILDFPAFIASKSFEL